MVILSEWIAASGHAVFFIRALGIIFLLDPSSVSEVGRSECFHLFRHEMGLNFFERTATT